MLNLNMGNVKTGAAPEGHYTLKIADIELKNNKAGDGQYLNVKCEIVAPEDYIGFPPIYASLSLKEQSLPYVKVFLEAVTQEDWDQDGMELDPSELVNKYAQATVIIKKGDDGIERNQIQRWFPDV